MHYIIESIFVGIYSCVIYLIIHLFVTNIYLLLFLTGVIKHSFGYLLNIHTLYCKYGYACNNKQMTSSPFSNYLGIESISEGLLFLFFGKILINLISNKLILFFIIGVLLHLIFEYLNIHYLFCKFRCI